MIIIFFILCHSWSFLFIESLFAITKSTVFMHFGRISWCFLLSLSTLFTKEWNFLLLFINIFFHFYIIWIKRLIIWFIYALNLFFVCLNRKLIYLAIFESQIIVVISVDCFIRNRVDIFLYIIKNILNGMNLKFNIIILFS